MNRNSPKATTRPDLTDRTDRQRVRATSDVEIEADVTADPDSFIPDADPDSFIPDTDWLARATLTEPEPKGAAPQVRLLKDLRNVGKAALADFAVLGIETVEALAARDPAELYHVLQERTGRRHDPCVQDVFAATIHQARTGEALDWWQFTPARKAAEAAVKGHRGTLEPRGLGVNRLL